MHHERVSTLQSIALIQAFLDKERIRHRVKKTMKTDTEFVAALTGYLAQFSEGEPPEVPLFRKDDGSIDREKTLALPCFANFHLEQ